MKRLRILNLPSTVGGHPTGLSKAFGQLGHHSEVWSLRSAPFGYASDKTIHKNSDSALAREVKRLSALSYVFRFDVVLFNFGTTLFAPQPLIADSLVSLGLPDNVLGRIAFRVGNLYLSGMQLVELSLLKLLRRKIVVQYQGDDARQADRFREMYGVNYAEISGQGSSAPARDALRRKQIRRLSRFADQTYVLNPDLLQVVPNSKFLPYAHFFGSNAPLKVRSRPLRVGHAPSHRGIKGTTQVIEAVKSLNESGTEIDLVLIEGKSNEEALTLYESLDLMVDQLVIGWYGGLAVESTSMGIPTLAYINERDLERLPKDFNQELAIVCTSPADLREEIQRLASLNDHDFLHMQERARGFSEKFHNPAQIALSILADIGSSRPSAKQSK